MLIKFNNIEIDVHKQGEMISLTDLWKAAGSPTTKAPKFWLEQDYAKGFIQSLCKIQKVTQDYLIKVKRGKGGGTLANVQIALEYAQYLNADLAVKVNQVFLERVEEEANPELAVERGNARAYAGWKKLGQDDKWIEARIKDIASRKSFTQSLAQHGVGGDGYRNCTNAVYSGLYGGTTAVVRMKKNLPAKASIRDNMNATELSAVMLIEDLSKGMIESQGLQGNAQCELACTRVSAAIGKTVSEILNMKIVA